MSPPDFFRSGSRLGMRPSDFRSDHIAILCFRPDDFVDVVHIDFPLCEKTMNIFSVPDGGVFFVFTIQEICPSRCLLLQKWSKFCKVVILVAGDWGSQRGIAASPYRSLPPRGRGTASAVDRVLSYIACLRRSSPALFHTARTLSGSLRSPPSTRGEGFVSGKYCMHTLFAFETAILSYRHLPKV